MTSTPMVPLAACIGLDWASPHHDIALLVAGTTTVESARIAHEPAALVAWLASLAERFAGAPVGIALETSRGPIVHALLDAPFVVLYPVNPRSLARFREAFVPSGAKDDAPDARLLLALLTQHRERLTPWQPEDAATRTLGRLVQHRRALVELRTQVALQLQAALKEYFPQALRWAGEDLATPLAGAFLCRWPTLAAVQHARPATLRQFYTAHHCRHVALIATRLTEIATATPLTRDPAIIESSALYVQGLARQLVTLAPSLAALDAAIAQRFAAHPDAVLFTAVPGAGAVLAPRLLVAFGTDRTRFPTATELQARAGIAPITVCSGKQSHVRWRWAASTFLRPTFQEFAHHSVRTCHWARVFYHQQRQRGKSHHAAVRSLAFKWIRILWRCWQDRVPYDDARYERALATRGSPLAIHRPLALAPA